MAPKTRLICRLPLIVVFSYLTHCNTAVQDLETTTCGQLESPGGEANVGKEEDEREIEEGVTIVYHPNTRKLVQAGASCLEIVLV